MAGNDTAGAMTDRNGVFVFSGGEAGSAQAQVTVVPTVDISGDTSQPSAG